VWKSFITPQLNGEKPGVTALLLEKEKTLWVGFGRS
jgi:hypothetical protein